MQNNTQTGTMSLKKTIVILHFAGGNCYSFQFLTKYLPGYEVVLLELPGRGRRMKEPLIKDREDAVKDLLSQFIKHNIQGDFIMYGHSMGATLGVLLARELELRKIYPQQLIASGSCGPWDGKVSKRRYALSSADFKLMLKDLGGISEQVLAEEDLFEFFEPVIRADFELLEKDNIVLAHPVKTPVHALMGQEEEDSDHIENWRSLTQGSCTLEHWPGEHFFIYDQAERLAKLLKEYAAVPRASFNANSTAHKPN